MELRHILCLENQDEYKHALEDHGTFIQERRLLLKDANTLFSSGQLLSSMTEAQRSLFLGTNGTTAYEYDVNLFGAPGGNGEVKRIISSGYPHFDDFFAAIPRRGKIKDDEFFKLLELFTDAKNSAGCTKFPFVLLTRLLTVTRPDTFVSSASESLKYLCKALPIKQVNNDPEKYWYELLPALHSKELFGSLVGDPKNTDLALLDSVIWNNEASSEYHGEEEQMISNKIAPLNQILYGPPGTGKTYHTIEAAVSAINPSFQWGDDRAVLKTEFDRLVAENKIRFVTFHQSFSYEEFVEGLKASTDNTGQIKYEIEDGIFKSICIDAKPEVEKASDVTVDVKSKIIWKMSLGNTLNAENDIFDVCINNNEVRLGYGNALDFSGCDSKRDIERRFDSKGVKLKENDYRVTAVNSFKNGLKQGDLIIITDGNLKFRAIAEVTGDYQHSDDEECGHYVQTRSVIWHRVYEKSLSYEKFMSKKFSQMTIYQPSKSAINLEKLQDLLTVKNTEKEGLSESEPRVLIIDEINRGNISKIFGELITLIEPSKRAGQPEALSVQLPYSKEPFSVPNNLYIIGTMNTADRSLAMMDTALRRRFDFVEMMPDYSVLKGVSVHGVDLSKMLEAMNDRIEYLYDREHVLGHAFFIPVIEASEEQRESELAKVFKNKVIPLLEEYFYEDWEKIRLVLGDNQKQSEDHQFVKEVTKPNQTSALFGKGYQEDAFDTPKRFVLNADALDRPESYQGILGTKRSDSE